MRQILKKFFKHSAGYTLVEALVATAILSATVVGGATMTNSALTLNKKSKLLSNSMILRKKIVETVNNELSWGTTVTNNSSMTCLLNRTPCPSNGSIQPFSLRTDTNVPLTDPNSSTLGFSEDLLPCNTFNPSGNSACPFRVELEWKPICSASVSGSCLNPQIEINGRIIYQPEDFSIGGLKLNRIDSKKFSLNFFRQDAAHTASSACTAINGTFNSNDNTCLLPIAQRECPDGQIVASISPEGIISCKLLFSAQCAPGQVLMGFDGTGKGRCENIKPGCCNKPPCNTSTPGSIPASPGDGDGGCDGDGTDGNDGCDGTN